MKFCRIFEDNYLHSVILRNGKDEFRHAFENWFDIEFLMNFFETHKSDLQSGFFGTVSVEQAVMQTRNDAKALQRKLLRISGLGKNERRTETDKLFVPLDNKKAQDLRAKAKGTVKRSWLRLYALKFDETLIVTGGAIKLTETMNERKHLVEELDKLRMVRDYLAEQGARDTDGFTEMIAEL